MEFYIVGSALTEKEPRDVDMFGVMEDSVFRSNFGMTVREFEKQRRAEEIGIPLVEKAPGTMKMWKEQTMGALRALQFIFPQLVPLDFKYLPESLLHEPCRRIDITAPPESWGIGFPNLENHVKRCPDDEL